MPAFTQTEFENRADRVQAEIRRRGLDALVVTGPTGTNVNDLVFLFAF